MAHPLSWSLARGPGSLFQVLVLRLKTVGTVEERIVAVASDKAQLADRSITGVADAAAANKALAECSWHSSRW